MTYCDDNYGVWDMDSHEDREFYHQVQRESIVKRCDGCGSIVKIRPEYGYCNSCATEIERGGDLEHPEIQDPAVDLELQLAITLQQVEEEKRRRREVDIPDGREVFEDEEF